MGEVTFTFRVDESLKSDFASAAKARDRTGAQLLRDFMRQFVQSQQDAAFREQVQIGIDAASAGEVLSADEVETEAEAWRAETGRQKKERIDRERAERIRQHRERRRLIASRHNPKAIAWLHEVMARLGSRGFIKGILIYRNMAIGKDGELCATLFLLGPKNDIERCTDAALAAAHHEFGSLMTVYPESLTRFFLGSFTCAKARRALARIDMPIEFFVRDHGRGDGFIEPPCIEQARDLLLPFVARVGDRRGPQLLRLVRWLEADRKKWLEEMGDVYQPDDVRGA